MKVNIVTDSSSGITPREAEELGITVIPLNVIFDGVEYRDNIDIDNTVFYEKLKQAEKLPTTAQPSADRFVEVFGSQPERPTVAILLSAKFSGTMQSASIAASELPGRDIRLVDSGTVAIGLRILVMRAIQLRDSGMDAGGIQLALEREKEEIVLMAVVDTLSYLHKGGRLSGTTALAGTLLGIKPVVTVKDGVIDVIGRERGRDRAYKFLRDTAIGMDDVDCSRPYALGYTAYSDRIEDFRRILGEEAAPEGAFIDAMGSIIGTHAGPGVVATAYFKTGYER